MDSITDTAEIRNCFSKCGKRPPRRPDLGIPLPRSINAPPDISSGGVLHDYSVRLSIRARQTAGESYVSAEIVIELKGNVC